MEMQAQRPPDQLPPPQLITGIGNVSLSITGSPEAQQWFNQGLNLIHDFWDYEALRAFEQGIRADSHCAMCYWGLYKAESFYHSNSPGYAAQALAQAVNLKDRVSAHERLYIEASAAPRAKALEIWRQLVKEYPRDTEARIFLANAVGGNEALQLLQSVLKEEPDNSAANHYYIHNVEGSDHVQDALTAAEAVARLAPASGHMVHMPGHVYFRLGEYARAEKAFAQSTEVDERYLRDQHVGVDDDWNYVHNLMYAVANFMEEGKFKEATLLSGKLGGARGELESTLYIMSARDSISRLSARLPVALRTANWSNVAGLLEVCDPMPARPNLDFLRRQLLTFALGMKAIEARDLARAQDLSTELDAELAKYPSDEKPRTVKGSQAHDSASTQPGALPQTTRMADALLPPILSTLRIMALELKGSGWMAQGKVDDAKAVFSRAARAEKALGYHEPPNYIRPVQETMGTALLAAGDWKNARTAYTEGLIERPRSGFALYGLALADEKSGEIARASKSYREFLMAWKDGDQNLPQIAHAREFLAAHPLAAN